jgi:hypothetical protein
MTPSGIEPATLRFVAQYLNHCATISGPHLILRTNINYEYTNRSNKVKTSDYTRKKEKKERKKAVCSSN